MASETPDKPREHMPELDVLRAFAFLGVFCAHWLPDEAPHLIERGLSPRMAKAFVMLPQTGAVGVMLFFCLSSYLITRLLMKELATRGKIDVRAFYVRRVLRIWPLYILFTIFSAVLPYFEADQRFGWKALVAFLLFAGNWVWSVGYPIRTVGIPLWSISVEEQFYLVWPWVVRRATTSSLRRTAVVLIVLAMINRLLVVYGVFHVDLGHNTFTQFDSIALGALIAVGLGDGLDRWKARYRVQLLVTCLVGLFASQLLRGSSDHDPSQLLFYPAVSMCCAGILYATLGARLDTKSAPVRLLTYLGTISYGLYVVHNFALYLTNKLLVDVKMNPLAGLGVRAIIGMTLSLALAAASFRFLEKPILRLKDRWGRPR